METNTNHRPRLSRARRALIPIVFAALGLGVGVASNPVEAAAVGCKSTRVSNTHARGSCTTLTQPSQIREFADCQNYVTGGVTRVWGPLVSDGKGSNAYCGSGQAIIRHWVVVYLT